MSPLACGVQDCVKSLSSFYTGLCKVTPGILHGVKSLKSSYTGDCAKSLRSSNTGLHPRIHGVVSPDQRETVSSNFHSLSVARCISLPLRAGKRQRACCCLPAGSRTVSSHSGHPARGKVTPVSNTGNFIKSLRSSYTGCISPDTRGCIPRPACNCGQKIILSLSRAIYRPPPPPSLFRTHGTRLLALAVAPVAGMRNPALRTSLGRWLEPKSPPPPTAGKKGTAGTTGPLGPLSFERAQHRRTPRPSVDGTRSKTLCWCRRSRVQSPAGMLRFHFTQCINSMVLESQTPHQIVNLLYCRLYFDDFDGELTL